MPLCDGRSDGPGRHTPCPEQRNDNSVRLSQGDLMLCEACSAARFPAISTERHTTDSAETSCSWIKSEILCFIADKGCILAFDQLVKICVDFYKEEEILAARQVIDTCNITANISRLPKRQGGNKLRATVEDIVKAVLNPSLTFPEFHAAKLSRLPPVDILHCDTSAILKELQGLRSEVREIRQLQLEVQELRVKLQDVDELKKELTATKSEVAEVRSIVATMANEIKAIHTDDAVVMQEDVGVLRVELGALRSDAVATSKKVDELRAEVHLELGAAKMHNCQSVRLLEPQAMETPSDSVLAASDSRSHKMTPTAADIVAAAVRSGGLPSTITKRISKVAYGKAANSKLQTARMKKTVHLFVTRLDPNTACDDVTSCVVDSVSNSLNIMLHKDNIKCERLKTKFDTYASFRVSTAVDESIKDSVIDLLMSGDGWPVGVLVRRFYYQRNG